jgi:hypothetical protein
MNKIEVENLIRDMVDNSQGLKGVELVTKVMSNNLTINNNELMDTLFDMIERGEFVEIEYELPNMGYRTKSFIVPKGTKVNVINKVKIR